jgi:hypothetical protein
MWELVGNTKSMFGNILTPTHLIIGGYFLERGIGSLIMYYAQSGNWHLGWIEGNTLGTSKILWNHVASQGFGNLRDGEHLNIRDDFDGKGTDDILFYNAGDGNWWFGWIEGYGFSSVMNWKLVGNTRGFGSLTDGYHLNKLGDFDGDGRDEILMYSSSDGDWWLIKIDGDSSSTYRLSTHKIGNLSGGTGPNYADYNHEVVPGKFTGAAKLELLVVPYSTRDLVHITVESGQIRIEPVHELPI